MNREMYQIIYYDLEMLKSAINILNEKKDKEFNYISGYKYAYILHDKDTANGKYKKAHYHLVLKFPTQVKSDRLFNLLKEFLPNQVHEDINKANVGAFAYLIHANDLKKFPYNFSDIVSNIDSDDLYDLVESHRTITNNHTNGYNTKVIMEILEDHPRINTVRSLTCYLLANGNYELCGWVCKNCNYVKTLMENK